MVNRTCTVPECNKKHRSLGYCQTHLSRYKRHGDPNANFARKRQACTIDGCTSLAESRGMCEKHYTRTMRHGCHQTTLRAPKGTSAAAKLTWHGWTEIQRVDGLTPCWEWNGNRFASGYGYLSQGDGTRITASRAAYAEWVGQLPEHLHVCHRCDNPPCINPDHLFAGTRQDNMDDCKNKLRHSYGERQGGSKLTELDVLEIRKLYDAGAHDQKTLAMLFNVSASNIWMVVTRRTWKHLPQ